MEICIIECGYEFFDCYVNRRFINRNCPQNVNVTLHLVDCDHTGNPAWAQNDAMMHAYMDNIAYYYRVSTSSTFLLLRNKEMLSSGSGEIPFFGNFS